MTSWADELAALFAPNSCLLCHAGGFANQLICNSCQPIPSPRWRDIGDLPVLVSAPYSSQMAKVVLAAKEENLRAAGATMAALMAQSLLWLAPEWLLSPGTLIPAPSRRRAKRRRGFDHAANLANSLTKLISGQVISPLEFSRGVQDQAHLSQSARLVNVSGRIRLPPRFINRLSNAPRPLVLLDDVLTSGATLRAAQAALLSRGFKAEFALVAASGASGHEANWRTF